MTRSKLQERPLPLEVERRYVGKWIAVRGRRVVADADDYDVLAADGRVRPEDDVFYVAQPTV